MAEGARLESVYTATYRGFESPPHRHIQERARTKVRDFFFACCTPAGGMRIPDRGSTTGESQLDRLSAQRTGCPKGERSESIPPSPPSLRKSSYESTGFFFACCTPAGGDENPRPGFDNWRKPVGQTERAANRLPEERAQRVNPPRRYFDPSALWCPHPDPLPLYGPGTW